MSTTAGPVAGCTSVRNGRNRCGSRQYLCRACGSSRVLNPKVRHSGERKSEVLRALSGTSLAAGAALLQAPAKGNIPEDYRGCRSFSDFWQSYETVSSTASLATAARKPEGGCGTPSGAGASGGSCLTTGTPMGIFSQKAGTSSQRRRRSPWRVATTKICLIIF